MGQFFDTLGQGLLMALGMAWKTGWSLVLGFAISALMQAVVPPSTMRDQFGRSDLRSIGKATLFGAASSSCSYASAAIMRTLFKKGAALATSLAFLFASTNLVIELGIILYLLLGWEFMVAEWVGGLVLIALMSVIVRLTYPEKLVKAAREHQETGEGHQHEAMAVEGDSWRERMTRDETRIRVAQNFTMEFSMLWKDLLIGFTVGGLLSAFVPDSVWQALFLKDAPGWLQLPANALVGPVVAMLTFVCSIGNVPLAAVLWAGGATFGGVLAFIYADLIVLPLIDAYRRYFGWKMALYIAALLFAAMALAAIGVDLAFGVLGLVPEPGGDIRERMTSFEIDYTFWLNLAFGALAAWLWWTSRKHPMEHGE